MSPRLWESGVISTTQHADHGLLLNTIFRLLGVQHGSHRGWHNLARIPESLYSLFILFIACFEGLSKLIFFSQNMTYVVSIASAIASMSFTIRVIRTRRLASLLASRKPSERRRLIRLTVPGCVILIVIFSVPRVVLHYFFLDQYPLQVIHQDDIISSLSARIIICSVWFVSNFFFSALLIVFFMVHFLCILCHTLEVNGYINEFKDNRVSSIRQAKQEHLRIVKFIYETKSIFEKYLVISLALVCSSILLDIYTFTKSKTKVSIFFVEFWFNVGYLLVLLLPCAVLTRRVLHVKKRATRLRAFNTLKVPMKDVDSFLLYLVTFNASYRLAGVEISMGFLTKLIITLFTICAFIVKHELSIASKDDF